MSVCFKESLSPFQVWIDLRIWYQIGSFFKLEVLCESQFLFRLGKLIDQHSKSGSSSKGINICLNYQQSNQPVQFSISFSKSICISEGVKSNPNFLNPTEIPLSLNKPVFSKSSILKIICMLLSLYNQSVPIKHDKNNEQFICALALLNSSISSGFLLVNYSLLNIPFLSKSKLTNY